MGNSSKQTEVTKKAEQKGGWLLQNKPTKLLSNLKRPIANASTAFKCLVDAFRTDLLIEKTPCLFSVYITSCFYASHTSQELRPHPSSTPVRSF